MAPFPTSSSQPSPTQACSPAVLRARILLTSALDTPWFIPSFVVSLMLNPRKRRDVSSLFLSGQHTSEVGREEAAVVTVFAYRRVSFPEVPFVLLDRPGVGVSRRQVTPNSPSVRGAGRTLPPPQGEASCLLPQGRGPTVPHRAAMGGVAAPTPLRSPPERSQVGARWRLLWCMFSSGTFSGGCATFLLSHLSPKPRGQLSEYSATRPSKRRPSQVACHCPHPDSL